MSAALTGRRLLHERPRARWVTLPEAYLAQLGGSRRWTGEEGLFASHQSEEELELFSHVWQGNERFTRTLGLDRSGTRLVRVTVDREKIAARQVADAFRVERIDLDPPVQPAEIRAEYHNQPARSAIVGNEYWVFGDDATIRERHALPLDYRNVMNSKLEGSQRLLLALASPVQVDRYDVCLLVLEPGREPVARTISIVPTAPDQIRIVTGLAMAAAIRPPLLNVAAMFRAPPPTYVGLLGGYWLDPMFAEVEHVGWAVASLIIALLCAAWVLVQARRRLRNARSVAFWTFAALLLGPTGALWMRISIPWVAIEDGRAVNIKSSDWPEPSRTGTEVIDSGAANPVDAVPLAVE